MNLGVLLPHTKLYGGVKRFLELGNIFVTKGHRFIVFTPDGKAPDWFQYKGEMATFDALSNYQMDALWTTTVEYMPIVLASNAKHKIFYHVRIQHDWSSFISTMALTLCFQVVVIHVTDLFHRKFYPDVDFVSEFSSSI